MDLMHCVGFYLGFWVLYGVICYGPLHKIRLRSHYT
jgi:hypothetical protein